MDDDLHSLVLETGPAGSNNEELEEICFKAGFDVLDNVAETSHNAVIGFNGGMAHVYTKNRATGNWSDAPRYGADVLVLAQRLYDNAVGLLNDDPEEGILGGIELVLVRNSEADGFNGPYSVMYRHLGWHGNWTYKTTQEALSITMNGNPLIPPGYADFVKNIDRLRDIRAGDIILMANFTSQRSAMEPDGAGPWVDGGYYFGDRFPAWHGSIYDTDMTIPLLFSFPHGEGSSLALFLSTVNAKVPAAPGEPARITDVTPTVYKLLTEEDY